MKILKAVTAIGMSLMIFAFSSYTNADKTISELVGEKQELSTLLTALKAAGLLETLKGDGSYTLFAPTNEAFENLPKGKLDELLKPENKAELVKILKYHVIADEYYASDLRNGEMVATLEGTKVKVKSTESMDDDEDMMEDMDMQYAAELKINNARVIQADLIASNGIIHIIDGVVMPSDIEMLGTSY